MNIIIFSWRGPGHPNAGGAEYVTMKHAAAWVKAGHDVTLFTASFVGAKDETIDGVNIVRRGGQVLGVRVQAVYFYLLNKHDKFDLVIDEFHGLPFFTPLFTGTKKLAFIHEVAKEVWKLNPWPKPFNLIPWFFGTTLERLIFLLYKDIPFMTVSESTKSDLANWGIPNKNITIVLNGVNTQSAPGNNLSKEKKKTIIFLGAISHDKGIGDALKVFNLINKTSSEWQFWVVGKASPDIKVFLAKQIKELGISGNTKYWGFVSDKKKYELLAKAHVLVNPSIREGWGLVNIEASAVGTPVIGYDVAGVRDSVNDGVTGILCNKSPEFMARAVMGLIEDKDKYKTMSEESKKWAKKFSWAKSQKASLALIEKV